MRENVLKKRLGPTSSNLAASIRSACAAMKADRTKSRLIFYSLLAAHDDKPSLFA